MDKDFALIRSLDYSHPYTTSVEHCLDLYRRVLHRSPRHIVELGSYRGVSTIALALAAKWVGASVLSVDLCDEVPAPERRALWEQHGLGRISSIDASANDYLRHQIDNSIDFIYHDAAHGDEVIPEYELAWSKVHSGGTLAVHDFDALTDHVVFCRLLGVDRYSVCIDDRGRQLVFLNKS